MSRDSLPIPELQYLAAVCDVDAVFLDAKNFAVHIVYRALFCDEATLHFLVDQIPPPLIGLLWKRDHESLCVMQDLHFPDAMLVA
jgi:hypothetical protein